MLIAQDHLLTLVNALYDAGTTTITVAHPCEEIGELLRIELEDGGSATVRFTQGANTYRENRETVEATYGETAFKDLPDASSYVRGVVAGGLVPPENKAEIDAFVTRYGYPDLQAGHNPVMIGLDANLMGFRMPDVLDIDPRTGKQDAAGRRATTGFALSKGVKKELDWHYKHHNTTDVTAAFGDEFEQLKDQPAGANREGFLGLYAFRRYASRRTADLVPGETREVETGDHAIIDAYRKYNEGNRKRVLLFSNDYEFVENAQDVGIWAHHVSFPVDMPRQTTVSWRTLTAALYILTVQFGVLKLPKATLYGVWNGKTGKHWQDEQLRVDCRSPVLEPKLRRAVSIVERFEQAT